MTAEPVTYPRHQGTYRCDPEQVAYVRAALRELLDGRPKADDLILIASELAANAVMHSHGVSFEVRCEVRPDYVLVAVEDMGVWVPRQPNKDDRPHGLDVVNALAGPGNWSITGSAHGRTVAWARLYFDDLDLDQFLAAANEDLLTHAGTASPNPAL
jgi:hypothetical protein